MEADIGITDKQYLLALTAFFFPYSFLEVSSIAHYAGCGVVF